jgi:UDPglucose--hexose-1-phosphate uridylyltransferase
MPRSHESSFERTGSSRVGTLTDLAALLRRTLHRIRTVTEAFHLVLHTSPNSQHPSATLGYWKTLDDDYHWHIEILPILEAKARSYTAGGKDLNHVRKNDVAKKNCRPADWGLSLLGRGSVRVRSNLAAASHREADRPLDEA